MTPEDLDAAEIDELLASIEVAEKSERRRHPRTPAAGHVPAVIRRAGSAPVRAALRDLSRSGAGLFSPVPMEAEELVDLELELRSRTVRVSCRVVSCRRGPDGRHVIGLEFQAIDRGRDARGTPSSASVPTAEHQVDDGSHADAVASRLATVMSEGGN